MKAMAKSNGKRQVTQQSLNDTIKSICDAVF